MGVVKGDVLRVEGLMCGCWCEATGHIQATSRTAAPQLEGSRRARVYRGTLVGKTELQEVLWLVNQSHIARSCSQQKFIGSFVNLGSWFISSRTGLLFDLAAQRTVSP